MHQRTRNSYNTVNKLPHDKTNNDVCPAKTQISLGIRLVWSESSLSTWRKLGSLGYSLSTQQRLLSDWADAQADLSLRWAHRSFCWFCHEAEKIDLHFFWSHFKSNYIMLRCFQSYFPFLVRFHEIIFLESPIIVNHQYWKVIQLGVDFSMTFLCCEHLIQVPQRLRSDFMSHSLKHVLSTRHVLFCITVYGVFFFFFQRSKWQMCFNARWNQTWGKVWRFISVLKNFIWSVNHWFKSWKFSVDGNTLEES